MAILKIVIEVDCDPTLWDPHDIAERLIQDHIERGRQLGTPEYSVVEQFIEAVWVDG